MFAVVKLEVGMRPVIVLAPTEVVFLLIPSPTVMFFIEFYLGEMLTPDAETSSWLE